METNGTGRPIITIGGQEVVLDPIESAGPPAPGEATPLTVGVELVAPSPEEQKREGIGLGIGTLIAIGLIITLIVLANARKRMFHNSLR